MSIQDTFQSIAFAGARFTSFTVNAVIFGLVPICLLVLRPAFASVEAERWAEGRRKVAERLEDLIQACLVASATATLIGIVLQISVLSGREGEVTMQSFTSFASTEVGQEYLVRLPVLAGLTVLLINRIRHVALGGLDGSEDGARPVWWASWIVLAGVLLSTSSFSGHAAVGNPRELSIGNDILHLMSGAAWFTGIIVLASIVPLAWRTQDEDSRLALMTPIIVRFSNLALVAIALVAITGTINSLFDVQHLRDLVQEGYGIALSVKIIIFLGILALGGFNHFYVRRKLEKGDDAREAARVFRRAIALELAFGLTIMGVTGVLTGLAKTRESSVAAAGAGGIERR